MLAVCNPAAGQQAAAELNTTAVHGRISAALLDVSDLASVEAFVDQWDGPLHMWINNAGVMALPELTRTVQGWEMQFATNFLGHHALCVGLHHALAAAQGARIVSVSSSGNLIAPVLFDDPHFHLMPYDPCIAYGQSKSACAPLAVEATRRWKDDGVRCNAVNPGAIATNLQRYTRGLKTPEARRKSIAQGAATSTASRLAAARWHRRTLCRGLPRSAGYAQQACGL